MNKNKIEYIVVRNTCRDILLEWGFVKSIDSYKYLGVTVTKYGTNIAEIKKKHIGQRKQVTREVHSAL